MVRTSRMPCAPISGPVEMSPPRRRRWASIAAPQQAVAGGRADPGPPPRVARRRPRSRPLTGSARDSSRRLSSGRPSDSPSELPGPRSTQIGPAADRRDRGPCREWTGKHLMRALAVVDRDRADRRGRAFAKPQIIRAGNVFLKDNGGISPSKLPRHEPGRRSRPTSTRKSGPRTAPTLPPSGRSTSTSTRASS